MTDERNAAIDALDPSDRLGLYIGKVSRASVLIENTLRHIWINLAGPGLAVALVPTGVDRLTDECVRMLHKSRRHGRDLKVASIQALRAAKAANAERDRYIHDLWMVNPRDEHADAATFIRHRVRRHELGPAPTTVTSDDLVSTYNELRDVYVRIDALEYAVGRVARSQEIEDEKQAIQVIRGQFDWRDGVPQPRAD
jgi:hypothetical protein